MARSTAPKDGWWEFRGDPEVDALRLTVADPTADYWDFTWAQYLAQSDGAVLDFNQIGRAHV